MPTSSRQADRLPDAAGYEVWLLRVGSLELAAGLVRPDQAVTICVNALLLRGHGETLLVDSGSGAADVLWPGAAELGPALEAAGARPDEVDAVHVAPAVQAYILSLVRATRDLAKPSPNGKARHVSYGASPRASLALYQAAKALAWLRGQDFVTPAFVQELAPDVLRHRIGLTYEAEAENLTADSIIAGGPPTNTWTRKGTPRSIAWAWWTPIPR